MVKTFILGLVLGIAGMFMLLYLIPAVDLYRESSHVAVQPNGGNVEAFHIDLPRDRGLAGMPAMKNSVPYGIEWPNDEVLAGSQAEIFKLRDVNNTVVGLASRMSSNAEASGNFVEWMLHLPARGSMFIGMSVGSTLEGYRSGFLRSGTGEFATLTGEIRETLLTAVEGADHSTDTRVELLSLLSGIQVDAE